MMPDGLPAALMVVSKALDGSPSPETVYGCQIILETLAKALEVEP